MNEIKLYKVHQTGKVGWWSIEIVEDLITSTVSLKTLSAGSAEAKPVESISPVEGKNIGRANETSAYAQACLELASKARKKMDGGYVEEEPIAGSTATNTLGFVRPQKAQAYSGLSDRQLDSIDWENAYVQRKYDGHRAMVKDGVMYSSGGKPIDLPHLKNLPTELHLDGELYIHGMKLQDIGALVKKYRPGETEKLMYVVFDSVGQRPFYERCLKLRALPPHASVIYAQTYVVNSMEDVMEYHKQFLAEGYEGTMLRHGTNGYKGGARAMDIIKVKDMADAEWIITNVLEAKTKLYQGNIIRQARLECWCPKAQKHFKVLAPGTVLEKRLPLMDIPSWVGKALTVQHFGFTSDGLPNLPVAKCLREDL